MLNPLLWGALLCLTPQAPAKPSTAVPPAVQQDEVSGGDVAVAPSRLILEGSKRSGELYLINSSDEPGHYELSFVFFGMKPDGDLFQKDLKDLTPEDHFAGDLLRFSPRELDLNGGESQVVRFRLRLPANLPEGEYRAHIFIRSVPKGPIAEAKVNKGHLSFSIKPTYGVSVPIIIRHGKLAATAGLSHLELATLKDHMVLKADLTRIGQASIYGNLEVQWTPAKAKTSKVVGALRGVAVYPEIPSRPVALPLADPEGHPIQGGTLKLLFHDPETGATLAQAEIPAP